LAVVLTSIRVSQFSKTVTSPACVNAFATSVRAMPAAQAHDEGTGEADEQHPAVEQVGAVAVRVDDADAEAQPAQAERGEASEAKGGPVRDAGVAVRMGVSPFSMMERVTV
jgi:hypothetical protein